MITTLRASFLQAQTTSITKQQKCGGTGWIQSPKKHLKKVERASSDIYKLIHNFSPKNHIKLCHGFLQCSSCTGGYYTEKLLNQTGFRMLVLNTNLYYDQNKLTQDMDDPAGQFSWADQVLTEATNNKEKANHLVYLCFATGFKLDLKVKTILIENRVSMVFLLSAIMLNFSPRKQ